MKHRTPARLAAALVGGSALAFAVPALAAVSDSSPAAGVSLSIVGDGQIIARGAQAQVTYKVMCPVGSSTFLWGSLTQRVGNGVASGGDGTSVDCTGGTQVVTLTFNANDKAFRKGTAATSAQLSSNTPGGFVTLEVDGPVTLQR